MRKLTYKDLKLTYLLSWYKYMKISLNPILLASIIFVVFPSARYETSSYLAERWSMS